MAQSSFPFENIDTTETQFSQMFRTLNAGVNGEPTGTQLRVTAGTGLQVSVAAGEAMVRGHFYVSTASESLAIATADITNPRIDSVVLRLDPVANSIVLAVVTGVPAASPVAPTLTQTDGGVFEYRLANVRVNAASGVLSTITDTRTFMGTRFGTWTTAGRPTDGKIQAGYNTTTAEVEFYNGTTWQGVVGSVNASQIVTTMGSITTNATITPAMANTIQTASTTGTITITVDSSLTAGQRIDFIATNTGRVQFAPVVGVSLFSKDSKRAVTSRYAAATLVCLNSTSYFLIGDLVA